MTVTIAALLKESLKFFVSLLLTDIEINVID